MHIVDEKALFDCEHGADITGDDIQWDVLIDRRVKAACAEDGIDPDRVRRDSFHVTGAIITATYFEVDKGICAVATLDMSSNSLSIKEE
ncbi:hypothetical protein KBD09_01950 [Candidatus Woesebacteria bacterium]|jgi:hypothetical protein|nr:hypothetical protein [Candidatus Woesebacteria bacterium]